MRITSLAALSAVLLVSVPAVAQTTQTSTATTTAAQTVKMAENDKKVCKRLATSGTRMAKRVCLTEEQWKKVDDEVK
jgi:hypothetical protein